MTNKYEYEIENFLERDLYKINTGARRHLPVSLKGEDYVSVRAYLDLQTNSLELKCSGGTDDSLGILMDGYQFRDIAATVNGEYSMGEDDNSPYFEDRRKFLKAEGNDFELPLLKRLYSYVYLIVNDAIDDSYDADSPLFTPTTYEFMERSFVYVSVNSGKNPLVTLLSTPLLEQHSEETSYTVFRRAVMASGNTVKVLLYQDGPDAEDCFHYSNSHGYTPVTEDGQEALHYSSTIGEKSLWEILHMGRTKSLKSKISDINKAEEARLEAELKSQKEQAKLEEALRDQERQDEVSADPQKEVFPSTFFKKE